MADKKIIVKKNMILDKTKNVIDKVKDKIDFHVKCKAFRSADRIRNSIKFVSYNATKEFDSASNV